MYINDPKPQMNIEFLATQALDFLMTEDGDYLVTNQSNIWTKLLKPLTSWTNLVKPTL